MPHARTTLRPISSQRRSGRATEVERESRRSPGELAGRTLVARCMGGRVQGAVTEDDAHAVVVGVDGRPASVNAVAWAVPEAVHRDVPLRLVHVCAPGSDIDGDDAVLCQAHGVAEGVDSRVIVQTRTRVGDPSAALLDESHAASLVCIGAVQPEPSGATWFGGIATTLSTAAHCPVAIVRTGFRDVADGAIATVMNDEADNDDVIHVAMSEGRLRRATVRIVDRRSDSWIRRYPDVHVDVVAAGVGAARDGAPAGPLQLAVVGRADADRLPSANPLNCHPIVGYPDCSVLVVRH